MNDAIFLVVGAIVICVVIYLVAQGNSGGNSIEHDSEATTREGPGSGWRSFGVLSIVLGAAAAIFGVTMKTSVSAPALYGSNEVVNLGLQQTQGLVFIGGLFGVGLGVLCLATGSILNALAARE